LAAWKLLPEVAHKVAKSATCNSPQIPTTWATNGAINGSYTENKVGGGYDDLETLSFPPLVLKIYKACVAFRKQFQDISIYNVLYA